MIPLQHGFFFGVCFHKLAPFFQNTKELGCGSFHSQVEIEGIAQPFANEFAAVTGFMVAERVKRAAEKRLKVTAGSTILCHPPGSTRDITPAPQRRSWSAGCSANRPAWTGPAGRRPCPRDRPGCCAAHQRARPSPHSLAENACEGQA